MTSSPLLETLAEEEVNLSYFQVLKKSSFSSYKVIKIPSLKIAVEMNRGRILSIHFTEFFFSINPRAYIINIFYAPCKKLFNFHNPSSLQTSSVV